ncbi:unnamed protein product [Ostreobium quekettii]|uniref:Exonuclease domain-containing protein n=1 Tax=Ostreobium quekettii TaxID=121088 RepID=A0A8S1J6U9_9CHLO|nr:unnamed protein product [Ostreobium quekettii]|eukprot:evm.model.scf_199.12 EVM.evm.TU.scf_199.12   scf_199:93097-97622(+)
MDGHASASSRGVAQEEEWGRGQGRWDANGGHQTSPEGAGRPERPGTKWPIRDPLVWIDLEMSGLDLQNDTILEIACILTDGSLYRQIEGPCIAIHHPDNVLDGMNEWCTKNHGASGLTQRCRSSRVSLEAAERQVLDFIKQYISPGVGLLAGNSVHVDKMFLKRYMPLLDDYMNHRILDVSTLMELCRRWYKEEYRRCPRKKNRHTAQSDIEESIEELKYYRSAIFKRT